MFGAPVHAKAFPGWVNLEALVAHVKFIDNHHRKIDKLAVVSDSTLFKELPRVVDQLMQPEVKHFPSVKISSDG